MRKVVPQGARELAPARIAGQEWTVPTNPSNAEAREAAPSASAATPVGRTAAGVGAAPTSYSGPLRGEVDARIADVRDAPSLEALANSPNFEPVFQQYLQVLKSVVPEEHLESAENLRRWVKDPEDSFNISTVAREGVVVGGAHTQIPESPKGAARENRAGSLEFAVGKDGPAIKEAVRSGIKALGTSARSQGLELDGIFADVPVGAKVSSDTAKALRSEGFELVYQGPQPPLEEGTTAQEVQVFYRPMRPGEPLTREKAESYFDAYWSSFASMEGDNPLSKLQQNPEYQQLRSRLVNLLPEERARGPVFELGSS